MLQCAAHILCPEVCQLPHCFVLLRCRAEEQRLEVSRALIDFQMEANEEKQAWANTK
jgi:hypothetical protein